MNNVISHDNENLKLLYGLAGKFPYKPATYTCITEFTDNFPKKKSTTFKQQYFPGNETVWEPEAPYPRLYTKSYKKSILTAI